MIDLQVTAEIRTRLATQFPDAYVGAPLESDNIELPAILLGIESDVVVGSPLQRGTLTASVQSSADDSTAEEHKAFAEAVDAFIRVQSIATVDLVMWPPVASRITTTQADRHWISELSYIIGFQRL